MPFAVAILSTGLVIYKVLTFVVITSVYLSKNLVRTVVRSLRYVVSIVVPLVLVSGASIVINLQSLATLKHIAKTCHLRPSLFGVRASQFGRTHGACFSRISCLAKRVVVFAEHFSRDDAGRNCLRLLVNFSSGRLAVALVGDSPGTNCFAGTKTGDNLDLQHNCHSLASGCCMSPAIALRLIE